MDLVYMLVMFLHIGAGVFWIGSIIYLRVLLLPALGRAAPNVRGPILADVGPRTVNLLLRIAELTIAMGIILVVLSQRATSHDVFLTTRWGMAILLGLLGALTIYALGLTVNKPTTFRIAGLIKASAEGQAPPDTPQMLAALGDRQRRVLTVQMGLGIFVVLCMAVARYS